MSYLTEKKDYPKLEVVLMDLFKFFNSKKRGNKARTGMGYQTATT
jgi:hypothetical protein